MKVLYTLLADEGLLLNAHDERSCSEVLWAAAWVCGEYCSELLEPQKLLPYLLQPEVSNLQPDTVAVYVQAVVKIFGTWAADLAQEWDEDRLPELQQTVQLILSRMEQLVSSPFVEVQERAANALELFTFVAADLRNWTSQPGPSTLADAPSFPKALYLIQPLFNIFELNPVSAHAQPSVPVPQGLDLDDWFVAPPPEPSLEESIGLEKKSRKGTKRKDKEGSGKKGGKQRKGKEVDRGNGDALVPVYDQAESQEDAEERERRKAERLAQLRDDPYYIHDNRAVVTAEDVAAIPVVHLDGMPSIGPRSLDDRLISLRAAAPSAEAHTFAIDRDGEMPMGGAKMRSTPPSLPAGRSGKPLLSSSASVRSAASMPIFHQYDEPGADLRPGSSPAAGTPEPIKVVRVKKAQGSGKKKKRTKP